MSSRTDAGRRGFTLIEALVTLLILTGVLIGLLTLLDSSSRLAKQETQVSDAQGGGRSAVYEITRLLRQARTGQLSATNAVLPWVNNAGASDTITEGTVTHTLRPGTDAVEVRGILFGETYYFERNDVTCASGACTAGDAAATVRIRQLTSSGYQNFAAAGLPELASRKSPFYFVVSTTSLQVVTGTDSSGSAPYSAPLYYVGRVNANAAGSWYTKDTSTVPATFRFTVDFTDAGARAMNATATTTSTLDSIFAGGAIDRLVLFVDQGPQDPAGDGGGFTHPYLAQAAAVGDGTWTVQRLIDDVEDLQFAYGVDGADGSTADRGVDPTVLSTTTAGADEWVFSAPGETLPIVTTGPRRCEWFLTGPRSLPSNPTAPAMATPALRAILVSVVVKSLDPDIRFDGPGAKGIRMYDSGAAAVSSRPYRRRVQTMAVNLRNYV